MGFYIEFSYKSDKKRVLCTNRVHITLDKNKFNKAFFYLCTIFQKIKAGINFVLIWYDKTFSKNIFFVIYVIEVVNSSSLSKLEFHIGFSIYVMTFRRKW